MPCPRQAELYAGVRTASETIGVQALAKDLGIEVSVEIAMDATAAMDIMAKKGLSTTRHIDVRWFWVQDALRKGRFKLLKVRTDENMADVFTKCLAPEIARKHWEAMGYKSVREGERQPY